MSYMCVSGVARRGGGSCRGRTLVIGLYFAFWGLYSVAVTFTAVSALLAALTGGTAGQLSGAAAAVRSVAGSVGASAATEMDRYAAAESRRLQALLFIITVVICSSVITIRRNRSCSSNDSAYSYTFQRRSVCLSVCHIRVSA